MATITRGEKKRQLKENAIRLAKHHKKHCEIVGCDIRLGLLLEVLEMAGIRLTEKEKDELL